MVAKPTLLIVDDKLDEAADYVTLFEDVGGFDVVTASSRAEAHRRVRAEPGVEAISTDVSLSSEGIDIEGAALAQELSEYLPGIPIAGYSGFRSRSDLPGDYGSNFDIWIEKGASADRLTELVERLRADALDYRARRSAQAATNLEEFTGASSLADEIFELVGRNSKDVAKARAKLSSEGYVLQAVMPVFDVDSALHAKSPVACWLRDNDGEWEGEVIGQPQLYASQRSPKKVLDNLVELIEVFADRLEIAKPPSERSPRAGPAQDLTEFLDSVIGRR